MHMPIPSRTKSLLPVAALCCLGIIGIAIVSTIVLALIPIYITAKSVTVANKPNSADTFYLQYSGDANADSSVTGTVENLSDVGKSLGFGSDAEITSGQAQASFVRRKRSLKFQRQKRDLKTNFLFLCKHKYKPTCVTESCRSTSRTKFITRIQLITSFPSFSISIRSGGVSVTFSFALQFVGFILAKPIGFAGESSTFQFVAIRSGAFNNPLTWAGGIVPYGSCSVVISAGVTVTLAVPALFIRMKKCDIYGSLALGSGSSSFRFNYATTIIVRAGGAVQDLTSNKNILIPASTFITVLSGGGFCAAGTIIQAYSSAGVGKSVTRTSASGPFTCGILPSGGLLSYNKVTFIAIKSGGFTAGSTFLGGLPPSSDICSGGGCGIQIESGVTLSTADLNGKMSLQIDEINVAAGAFFELGTAGSTSGFKFLFSIQLNVLGRLNFVGSGGGILIPSSSAFNFFGGGSFTSIFASAFIQVFSLTTGLSIGTPKILGSSFTGPYFITISVGGVFLISVNGVGDSDTTTMVNSATTGLMG
ncbi:unnamed protein product [Rotaria socialis]|uniref:Uncharacterized protein n=1 Tax=Rotaria socialis TaxID=392032 RepID=A0A818SFJ4_9BILA|nr:unnamed protein product [Rotaria socialis]